MTVQTKFSDVDLCVKCGLCLPHCPTYTLSQNENESPRGRLALIQGWSEGQLELSDTLTQHIGNCLTCRACEKMCPAQVPYAEISNRFRSETATSSTHQLGLLERSAIKALTGPYRKALNALLRFYLKTGLNKYSLTLNEVLPGKVLANQLKQTYPSLAPVKQGHVALFTGCASEVLDSKTIKDAIFLLQHCGFNVTLPKTQRCCGAIDLHAGKKKQVASYTQQNHLAFSDNNYDAIITIASGCGATLSEYDPPLTTQVIDISDFIAPFLPALSFKPLTASAWLHTPCTLKNVQSKGTDIVELLNNISELDIRSFNTDQMCCGAAGTQMLTHKKTAQTLRKQTLMPIKQRPTDYLLSSNIGCALHLNAGLKSEGLNSQVLHPVSLLSQQLKV